MWDRATLKSYAKMELKQSYWLSLGVAVVANIIVGGVGGVAGQITMLPMILIMIPEPVIILFSFLLSFGLMFAVILAVEALLSGPITVGLYTFFLHAPFGRRDFSLLFCAFKKDRYLKIAGTMLLYYIKVFLWSLLFIVPGIVKSYEYRMVPFIVSENPNINPAEALRLSSRMTEGHKGQIFLLDLSFIGWALLGSLAFGFGVYFVMPYIYATEAQLYMCLRQNLYTPPAGQGGWTQP